MLKRFGTPPSERAVRDALAGIDRDAFAESVHLAIIEHAESLGLNRVEFGCAYYTLTSWQLLMLLGASGQFLPQAGQMMFQPDASDPELWVGYQTEATTIIGGGQEAVYHTWLGSPGGVLIDLTTRHIPAWIRESSMMGAEYASPSWNHPEPPPAYLWRRVAEVPSWASYEARRPLCDAFLTWAASQTAALKGCRHSALRHYQRLAAANAARKG